jgi:hypothetical protein
VWGSGRWKSWWGRTGDSRFLTALGMTISFRNCHRKAKATAKEEADPCGMTARKAKSRAKSRATARATTRVLHCVQDDGEELATATAAATTTATTGSFTAFRMTAKNLQQQRQQQVPSASLRGGMTERKATVRAGRRHLESFEGMRNLEGLLRIHRVCTDTVWHWRMR